MKDIRGVLERDRIRILRLMALLPLFFTALGLGAGDASDIVPGLGRILRQSDLLLTDYILVGGLGAAMINAALMAWLNLWIIARQNIQINGSLIATFFTVSGFCFMGINPYNVLPLYLGAWLYTRYQEVPFKNVILIAMLGSGVSPIVGQLSFNAGLAPIQGVTLGVLAGVLTGFILPPLSGYLLRVHAGYNIYNIGFTAGVIGTLMVGFLRGYGVAPESAMLIANGHDLELALFCLVISLGLLYVGLSYNDWKLTGLRDIMRRSGRLVTDFTQLDGYGPTFINMALMGAVSILLVLVMDGSFNGPVVAGIFTVIGFAAFGKHPLNSLPVMLGVYLAAATSIYETPRRPS